MKIALVHYRFFQGDGPERYFFNIKDILEQNGHSVAPFSIHNSRNEPSPYSRFFLSDVDDEVHYGDGGHRMSPTKVVKSFSRMYYSPEARHKFGQFLDEVKPDLVYILQYHNKISPSILFQARRRGIPIVHRISDFQYMCPNALFFTDGHICEDCLNGHSWSCVRHRCVHGSRIMSALKLGAKKLHDAMGVKKMIDAFVVPSSFTLGKLAQWGIEPQRLHHIPTFYNPKGNRAGAIDYKPYFVYMGRIAEQKGVRTLIKAFAGSGMSLKIIGTSADGLIDELKASLNGVRHDIEFLGYLPFEQIVPYLENCTATIVPSEWYDNFPNVILESFGYSKPVIASALGSLLETVGRNEAGLTFPAGNPDALRAAARQLIENPDLARRLGQAGKHLVETEYSPQTHYRRLIDLFTSLINRQIE